MKKLILIASLLTMLFVGCVHKDFKEVEVDVIITYTLTNETETLRIREQGWKNYNTGDYEIHYFIDTGGCVNGFKNLHVCGVKTIQIKPVN